MDKNYEDIINLEHFHAPGKPYMKMSERAAQFAAYKSLEGYEYDIPLDKTPDNL